MMEVLQRPIERGASGIRDDDEDKKKKYHIVGICSVEANGDFCYITKR